MNKIAVAIGSIVVIIAIAASIAVLSPMESDTTQQSTMTDDGASTLSGSIPIGIMLPLTGDLSSHGEENLEGSLYGIETFNDYLDSIGQDWYLDPVVEDTATNPVQALEKIQNLKAKNIELVIGPETSSSTSSVLQYADNNNMMIFSCCSTSPALAIPNDNVFRLVPDDRQQGKAMASLLQHHGIEAVIVMWRGDTYGDGLSENLKKSFTELGGFTDDGIRYNPESPDFSVSTSILAERTSALVDEYGSDKVAIFVIAFAESLQFVQSATQHDVLYDVRWFGSDSLANTIQLVQDPIGLEFSQATQFTTLSPGFASNPISDDVKETILELLGRYPSTFVETSYDIAWIYGMAMLNAQSDRFVDIYPIIQDSAKEYSGAIGEITLNENGDLHSSDYTISAIIDGDWVDVGTYLRDGTIVFDIEQ